MPVETKLFTYVELGAALGITPASAKRLAIRKSWPKKPGNDGRARVVVPIEVLPVEPPSVAGDATSDNTSDAAGDAVSDGTGDKGNAMMIVALLSDYIARIEGELEAVRAKLDIVECERDAERARAVQVDVLNAVLEVERRGREELRRERDEAAAELRAALERVGRAEHDRDRLATELTARMALPWWRRLFA